MLFKPILGEGFACGFYAKVIMQETMKGKPKSSPYILFQKITSLSDL